LRAALVWSQRLDGPRTARIADLIASLDVGGANRSALFV
jgi:hypothetical protein